MVAPTALAQTYSYATFVPTYTAPTYTTPTYTTPTYTTPTYTTQNYYSSGSTGSGSCVKLSQNLYSGLSDTTTAGAVSQLQKFLAGQGYFTHSTTGYFGPVTLTAVQAFQSFQGISATGYVGSLTRAAIQRVCGSSLPAPKPKIQSLLPSSGRIGESIVVTGSGFLADNAVYFDSYPLVRLSSRDGTTLGFVVPASLKTTKVVPGQHTVFVQNANGSSDTLSFVVLTTNIITQRPTIQTVDVPWSLYAGQSSTWVVRISIPSNYTNSSYLSARWGDENLTSDSYSSGNQSVSGSTVTITHTYSFSGNYMASFTLSDGNGQVLASEALSVNVR
ncbi:MAG: peptidoglycan-binding domain-containing protein [bacterium]|nr:peptidoglycan-binding domain-containing protein [bacterium]